MGRKRAAVKKSSVSSNPPQLSPIVGNAALDSTGTKSADRVHVEAESFVASAFSPEDVDGDHVPVPLPRKSKASVSRAECWNHMDKREIVENGIKSFIAICHYCKTELSADSAGGTGHLNQHFKACLKKVGQTLGAGVQTQLNFAADGTVSTWVYNPQVAREEIIKYIVSEDLPIMMGESPNFKNLIQRAFCPQYQSVSRTTTKHDLVSLFNKTC